MGGRSSKTSAPSPNPPQSQPRPSQQKPSRPPPPSQPPPTFRATPAQASQPPPTFRATPAPASQPPPTFRATPAPASQPPPTFRATPAPASQPPPTFRATPAPASQPPPTFRATPAPASQPPPTSRVSSEPESFIQAANVIVVHDANNYLIPDFTVPNSNVQRSVNLNIPLRRRTDKFPLSVCSKYNGKKECPLKFCYRFHVCQFWIKGDCKMDPCSLDHSFESSINYYLLKTLESRNYGEENLKESLKKNMYHKKGIKVDPSDHICMDFILNRCKRDNCSGFHIKSTYSWEMKLNDKWLKFSKDQNINIEKFFNDPVNEIVNLFISSRRNHSNNKRDNSLMLHLIFPNQKCNIDFNAMSLVSSGEVQCPVRRLSTPSDITYFRGVATRWLWYWEDDVGEWNFYGNAFVNEMLVIPFSDYLETQYLKNTEEIRFKLDMNGAEYSISFINMSQTNQYFQRHRRIRRRPMPSLETINWRDDCTLKSLWTSKASDYSNPRQKVNNNSPEFFFVKQMVDKSLSVFEMHIERIENHHLWNAYQLRKSIMLRTYKNDLKKINEQYLFHGTTAEASDKICKENFECRLYGTHVGNAFGKGAYFANSARIANLYTSEFQGFKYMFVALVLVGTASIGNKSMAYPPVDPKTELRFDSTVNSLNPEIFVKYNMDEYYPVYLIKYKE